MYVHDRAYRELVGLLEAAASEWVRTVAEDFASYDHSNWTEPERAELHEMVRGVVRMLADLTGTASDAGRRLSRRHAATDDPNRDLIAWTIAQADLARAGHDRDALDEAWSAIDLSDADAVHRSLARSVLTAAEAIFEPDGAAVAAE